MTYYKYAERDEASRVDWGAISKTWTETINKGLEAREKKRQDIDTATRKLTEEIIAAPEGTHRGVAEFYSQYAGNAQDLLLDAERKLKSGNMKVRDYTALMANMTTDAQQLTSLGQYYMDNHTQIMERFEAGDSQPMEMYLAETFQDHTNFSNTAVQFDPTTGRAVIVRKFLNDDTGLYEYGDPLTLNQMRSAMGTRYDRYRSQDAVAKAVSEIGKWEEKVMRDNLKTREDARRMTDLEGNLIWEKMREQMVDAMLARGLNVSSILTTDMEGYDVTRDANAAGDDDVMLINNPLQNSAGDFVPMYEYLDTLEKSKQARDEAFGSEVPEERRMELIKIAREQRENAAEWARNEIDRGLPMIETTYTTTTGGTGDTDAARKQREAQESAYASGLAWMQLAYGKNQQEKEGAERQLLGTAFTDDFGIRRTISGVDATTFKDKVVITTRDADGQETTQEYAYSSDNRELSPYEWAQSGSIFYQEQVPFVLRTIPNLRNELGNPVFTDMTVDRPQGAIIDIDPQTGQPVLSTSDRLGVYPQRPAMDVPTRTITPFASATVGDAATSPIAPEYFQETAASGDGDEDIRATEAAVLGALGAMGVDARFIMGLTEGQISEASGKWYTDEVPVLRFYIPGATADPIFVPNNSAGLQTLVSLMNRLPQLFANPLTKDEANKEFGGTEDWNRYNKDRYKELEKVFGVGNVSTPTGTTPTGTTPAGTGGGSMAQFSSTKTQ